MRYQLKELFDNLEITLTELKRRSGISDVTLISIRNGHSARRSTINTLLRVFSEIYGVKLTLQNVDGIIIQGKPVSRPTSITPIAEKVIEPSVPSPVVQSKPVAEKPQKRAYNRKEKDTGLPAGAMLAIDFAKAHGRNERSFRDDMLVGLGPGLIHGPDVDEDGIYAVKDYVRSEERPKPSRPHEKERYLTQEQQAAALAFWQRHDVNYSECDQPSCACKGE